MVDVEAVREADLGRDGRRDAPLGGAALRNCIQGEGDPPRELLLAAVACVASGWVRRVPVQRLREDDAIGSLNLGHACLGAIGAALLGLMLPAAATSMRSLRCPSDITLATLSAPVTRLLSRSTHLAHPCSLSGNAIGDKGASALAAMWRGAG